MSVRREIHSVVFDCDGCSNDFDSDTNDSREAVAEVKKDGWIVRKAGDDWEHYCPVCVKGKR